MRMLDAKASAYLAKELEYIKNKVYEIEYDDLMFDSIFSVKTEVNPGANTIVRQIMDHAGKAKRMNGHAGDLPRVDVTKSEIRNPVILLADSYGYNIDEIEAGAMTGLHLNVERAKVARRKIEEEMNEIAWFGDVPTGILGFLTNPDIGSGNAAAAWSTLTPAALLAEVNKMFTAVITASRGKKKGKKLLLDPTERNRLFTTPRSDTSDTTLGMFLVNNIDSLGSADDIVSVPEFLDIDNDGTGTKGAAVLDNADTECEIDTPRDVTFHNEQEQGLEIVVPVSARYAGLSYMYPTGAYIEKDV